MLLRMLQFSIFSKQDIISPEKREKKQSFVCIIKLFWKISPHDSMAYYTTLPEAGEKRRLWWFC